MGMATGMARHQVVRPDQANPEVAKVLAAAGRTSLRSVAVLGVVLAMAGPMVWAQSVIGMPGSSGPVGGGSEPETGDRLSVAPRRQVEVAPRIEFQLVSTSNAQRTAIGQAETYIEVSPGIRIQRHTGPVKGSFDYALRTSTQQANAGNSGRLRHSLNTFGQVEFTEQHAQIDFTGNVSRQAASAFGPQTGTGLGDSLDVANATEVRTFRVSPSVKARLGSAAQFELRYAGSVSRNDSLTASNVTTNEFIGRIGSAAGPGRASWGVELQRQLISYSRGRDTASSQARVTAGIPFDYDWTIGASIGYESNNFRSVDEERKPTVGFNLRWQPSDRTLIASNFEHRFFGNSHRVEMSYRTPLSVWKLASSRDVSYAPNGASTGSIGRMYDLLYSQMAAIEPDPIARAAMVNSFLASNGLSADAQVIGGLLTNGPTLSNRQELSWAWLVDRRNTFTFALTRGSTARLGDGSQETGDLANNTSVRQTGFSVNYAYKLSPQHSLAILGARQNSKGSSTGQEGKTTSFNLTLTSKLGEKASATLGARRVQAEGITNNYSETAVTGNLSLRF